MILRSRLALVVVSAALASGATCCVAAPYELTVYGDDLPDPGEGELETIFSLAKPRPDDDIRSTHIGQAQFELGYGLSKQWAVGLEIPVAFAERTHKVQGASIEVEYLAPHDDIQGGYVGLRADVGREGSLYESEVETALELNPILGYRWGRLHMTANPTLEIPIHAAESRARFRPSAKAVWRLVQRNDFGVEYYGNWGALNSLLPRAKRDETVYAIWEDRISHCRINAGLGRGLHPTAGSADRWVAKVALEFELD